MPDTSPPNPDSTQEVKAKVLARNIPEFLQRLGRGGGGVSLSDDDSRFDKSPSQSSAGFDLEQGQRYRHEQLLGSGGMGEVRQTKDLNIRRHVAMKKLRPDRRETIAQLRFIEEAQVTGQMEHPGIVPVYELGVDEDGTLYYTMKLVKGVTLHQILLRLAERDVETARAYPLPRLLRIFMQVLDAVAFAHHKGVVHRDLKPDNIMIGDFGEVVVMDWGLAKVLRADETVASRVGRDLDQAPPPGFDGSMETVRTTEGDGDASFTHVGQLMGTPRYMAPEQSYTPDVDERADIYALGGILYYLLALRPALEGKEVTEVLMKLVQGEVVPPAQLNLPHFALPHIADGVVPPALSAVTMRAMQRERAGRYSSVKDLQSEIDAYLNGYATVAEDAGTWRHVRLFIRRHQVESALSSVAAMLLVGIVILFVGRLNTEKNRAVAGEQTAIEARQLAEDLRLEADTQRQAAVNALDAARTAEAAARTAAVEARAAEADAETQRQAAVEALKVARAERQRAAYEAYVANIGLAQSQLAAGQVQAAARSLDRCDADMRNWEWNFLRARLTVVQQHTRSAHPLSVLALSVADNGRWLASVGEFDTTVRLWPTNGGKPQLLRSGLDLVDVDLSPGGLMVATLDGYNTLQLWNPTTGKLVTTDRGSSTVYFPGRIAFSPNGRYLAALISVGDHRELWLYDAQHAVRMHKLSDLPKTWEADIAWTPDGERLAVTNGMDVELWDPLKPARRDILRGHSSFVFSLAVSQDGQYLAAGGRDQSIRVWNLRELKAAPQILAGHTQAVNAVAFVPNTNYLLSGGNDGQILVWDRSSGQLCGGMAGEGVQALAVSTDGRTFWAGYADGSLGSWPLAGILAGSLYTQRTSFTGFTWEQITAYDPSGHRLIIADPSTDNPAALLDATTGSRRLTFPAPRDWAAAAWSPDGASLIAATPAGQLYRYSSLTGSEAGVTVAPFADLGSPVNTLAWSPDGATIAASGPQGASLLSAADATRLWQSPGPARAIRFAPDGASLLLCRGPLLLRLAIADGTEQTRYEAPETRDLQSCAISADGSTVAAVGDQILIWNTADATLRSRFPENPGNYRAIVLNASGDRAFTGGRHVGVRVWETANGRPLITLREPRHWVVALALAAEGTSLASADQSGNFILYPAPAPPPAPAPAD